MSSYHAYTHVRRVIGLTAVLAALFAGGCASATRIPLSSAHRASASPAHVVVGLRQQEIGTSIVPSNASAAAGAAGGFIGGLIGGIVDASIETSRAKKAESAVVPLRDSLVGYDIGSTLSGGLSAEFASIAWLKVEKAEYRSLTQDGLITQWVAESTGNFVLIIELDYRTSPEFDAIALKAKVTGYARATGAKNLPAPVYQNTLATLLPLPDRPDEKLDREETIALWVKDNGAKARATLDTGLRELTRMLAYDFEQDGPPNKAVYKAPTGAIKRTTPQLTTFGIQSPVAFTGFVAREEESRQWVRIPDGTLIALAK
jgi:hypothetical protein